MPVETILIVDDEQDIRELLQYNLEKERYKTFCAKTGEEAIEEARKNHPDLIILDLMLPGIDGLEVCRRLKQDERTRRIPILMVTAKGEDSDIILGLEMGAEDYIIKPFSPKVLTARVRTIFRRGKTRESMIKEPVVNIHGISLDTQRFEVYLGKKQIQLSVTEFSILEFLCRNPGWVFSRGQIIGAVKGSDYPVTERSVDVQILGLRKKLEEHGKYIETVRGIGYRIREEE